MSEKSNVGVGMSAAATATRNKGMRETLGLSDTFQVECRDSEGNLKWVETIHNLVTDEGLNYALDTVFKAGTQQSSWFVGLLTATPTPVATDTAVALPTIAGGTEFALYTGGTRPGLTLGAISGSGGSLSASNTASQAVFTMDTGATSVGGCFIVAGTGANTKSSSVTGGVLYGVGAFSTGNKAVDPADTLNVTVTVQADSGA